MDLNQNYKTGHVKPWWTDEYKNLEFIQKPFNNEEDLKSIIELDYQIDYFDLTNQTIKSQIIPK